MDEACPASAGEEIQGGSYSNSGTKGVSELLRSQFIFLTPDIFATVLSSEDGQEFDTERRLKLAQAKIRFEPYFLCLFIYSFTSGLQLISA